MKSNLQRTLELTSRALNLVQRLIAEDSKQKADTALRMANVYKLDMVGASEEAKQMKLEQLNVKMDQR